MNKLYHKIINIFFVIMLLAGCVSSNPFHQDSLPESVPTDKTPVSLDDYSTKANNVFLIRLNIPYIGVSLYSPEREGYFSIGRICTAEEVQLSVLLTMALQELDYDVVFRSVDFEKGELIVDWHGNFAEAIQKDQLLEITILNTVGRTLLNYVDSAHYVLYKVDGVNYQSPNMEIEGGHFEPAPLEYAQLTAEEYTELRSQIPYLGLTASDELNFEIPYPDNLSQELWSYLKFIQDPRKEFTTLEELDNDYILSCAYGATSWMKDADFDLYGHINPYHKHLRFFSTNTNQMFKLKEHVEASAQALFQKSIVNFDRQVNHSGWVPEKEVYAPIPIGGSYLSVPIITEYEDMGTSYRVFVAYLEIDMGSYSINGETYSTSTYPQIDSEFQKVLLNATPEREFIVDKKPDGGFLIRSHNFLHN